MLDLELGRSVPVSGDVPGTLKGSDTYIGKIHLIDLAGSELLGRRAVCFLQAAVDPKTFKDSPKVL